MTAIMWAIDPMSPTMFATHGGIDIDLATMTDLATDPAIPIDCCDPY